MRFSSDFEFDFLNTCLTYIKVTYARYDDGGKKQTCMSAMIEEY